MNHQEESIRSMNDSANVGYGKCYIVVKNGGGGGGGGGGLPAAIGGGGGGGIASIVGGTSTIVSGIASVGVRVSLSTMDVSKISSKRLVSFVTRCRQTRKNSLWNHVVPGWR